MAPTIDDGARIMSRHAKAMCHGLAFTETEIACGVDTTLGPWEFFNAASRAHVGKNKIKKF